MAAREQPVYIWTEVEGVESHVDEQGRHHGCWRRQKKGHRCSFIASWEADEVLPGTVYSVVEATPERLPSFRQYDIKTKGSFKQDDYGWPRRWSALEGEDPVDGNEPQRTGTFVVTQGKVLVSGRWKCSDHDGMPCSKGEYHNGIKAGKHFSYDLEGGATVTIWKEGTRTKRLGKEPALGGAVMPGVIDPVSKKHVPGHMTTYWGHDKIGFVDQFGNQIPREDWPLL